jgi:ornithine cyclodeaminase/alanine dehydrogenase-like protein (mu-crystallin family)
MIFGTGVQAFTQVLAVHEARPLRKLLAWSVDPLESREAFARKITAKTGVPVELVSDPAAAAREADVVALATSSAEPVIDGSWFKAGTHINGIGSHTPKTREIDTLTVQRSRVICDLTDACRSEAGDFIIPAGAGAWSWDRVAGDLGDVVLGRVQGRTSPDEITLFKSVGLAIQDVSAAKSVYDAAVKGGIGSQFEF